MGCSADVEKRWCCRYGDLTATVIKHVEAVPARIDGVVSGTTVSVRRELSPMAVRVLVD